MGTPMLRTKPSKMTMANAVHMQQPRQQQGQHLGRRFLIFIDRPNPRVTSDSVSSRLWRRARYPLDIVLWLIIKRVPGSLKRNEPSLDHYVELSQGCRSSDSWACTLRHKKSVAHLRICYYSISTRSPSSFIYRCDKRSVKAICFLIEIQIEDVSCITTQWNISIENLGYIFLKRICYEKMFSSVLCSLIYCEKRPTGTEGADEPYCLLGLCHYRSIPHHVILSISFA